MNKLAAWLKDHNIRRSAFAKNIGVSNSLITQLCDGTVWPGRDVAARIAEETGGVVTANDFVERLEAVSETAVAE